MIFIPDAVIDALIAEDVPYIDLTTHLLDIGSREGEMAYFTREDAVLCGTEEVRRILERFHLSVTFSLPSGSAVEAGQTFLRAAGKAEALHMAWKVCQTIFEYCSGIATKTRKMVELARRENPHVSIVTTRKSFPGTKALAIKAVIAGGAMPHRLGISETILVFEQHMKFLGGLQGFLKQVPELKQKACEKKLIVEAHSVEDGLLLLKAGVDGLQLDKLSPAVLKEAVPRLREANPGAVLLAAGGITEQRVAEYARTGVDALVTTSVYQAKPLDIGVRMK